MPKKKAAAKPKVKQALDMTEHAARLRAIPTGIWDTAKRLVVWLAAGVLLCALAWLAITR